MTAIKQSQTILTNKILKYLLFTILIFLNLTIQITQANYTNNTTKTNIINFQDHFQLDKSTNSQIKTETAVKENETTNTKTWSKLDPVNPNTWEFTYDNTLCNYHEYDNHMNCQYHIDQESKQKHHCE